MQHIRLPLAMTFFLCACQTSVPPISEKQQVHDKIVQNIFPWNKATEVLVFSFEQKKKWSLNYDSTDPLGILNHKPLTTQPIQVKHRWYGKVATGNAFMDSIHKDLKPDEIVNTKGHSAAKQCAFDPHHAICFIDRNNKIFAYELVCLSCAERRSYGGKLRFTGSYQSLFRFCQFNGLDWALDDLNAFHNFATEEEIACMRLRKFPAEKLVCKGE